MSDETPRDVVASPSQTVGPFFHFGLTTNAALAEMAGPGTPGVRIRLQIHVFDGVGAPVPDAMVEVWQAGANGANLDGAAAGEPAQPNEAFRGWGRLPTNDEGLCEFHTVRPGRVKARDGRLQASHINVCLFMRGMLRQVHTRIYFADDPALAEDVALNLVPAERRPTLLATAGPLGVWTFDIRMQGEAETVFFNI